MWKVRLNAFIAVLGLALVVAISNAEEQMPSDRGRALGDSMNSLLQQLTDGNPHTRMQAADALGQIKDVRAVKLLVAVLEDENSSGRTQALAAGALVSIGTPAVEPLIAALKDQDPLVRIQAADALGQIKDVRAVEPLIGALKDRNPIVRMQIADALGQIKDVRGIEPLITALKDEDPLVRERVVDALEKIKDVHAVSPKEN